METLKAIFTFLERKLLNSIARKLGAGLLAALTLFLLATGYTFFIRRTILRILAENGAALS